MRSSSIFWVSIFSLFLAGFSGGIAEGKGRKGKPGKRSKIGDYDGIVAGHASILPPGARRGSKKKPHVYWVGFQPQTRGTARVFVQLGKEVQVQQRVEGQELVVLLEGARIGNRSVQRYLDTRYFDTSIEVFRTRQVRKRKARGDVAGHDKGVELRFQFKNPVDAMEANLTVASEEDGYSYIYLDFGRETEALSEL